jgi:hypothetical protein
MRRRSNYSILEDTMDRLLETENMAAQLLPQIGNTEGPDCISTKDIIDMVSSADDDYDVKSFTDVDRVVNEMYNNLFEASVETPDEMKRIVEHLESKGYKVKYASPGHLNTKFKNDRNGDRISNSKMVSTARIIFKNPELKIEPPYLWELKIMDDCTGLYVKPYTYNEASQGSKDEAFIKWKENYMKSLDEWAHKSDNIDGTTQKKRDKLFLTNAKAKLVSKKENDKK